MKTIATKETRKEQFELPLGGCLRVFIQPDSSVQAYVNYFKGDGWQELVNDHAS